MPKNKYSTVEDSIQKILKGNLTLKDEEKKKYNKTLIEFFDILIEEMKKQEDFKELFRQRQYVGSYYENLKIGFPDEFDIDFELVMPSYIGKLQVCVSPHPGFCCLKLDQNTTPSTGKESVKSKVKKWYDEKGFLLRAKVHDWMKSVIDNAVREYNNSNRKKTFKIIRTSSGPAVTLEVHPISDPSIHFSVDLVPVFVFEEWPTIVYKLHKWKKEMIEKRWYAVPKSKNSDKDFRISFWHQEKNLLSGKNQMKPVLKLMKKLRDVENWKMLSSYYIKTIFLWKNDENTASYWSKGMGELFVEMLNELQQYLSVKKVLPFYWVKEHDLLGDLHQSHKEQIAGRLKNIVSEIERNLDTPNFILKFFNLEDRSSNTVSAVVPAFASLHLAGPSKS